MHGLVDLRKVNNGQTLLCQSINSGPLNVLDYTHAIINSNTNMKFTGKLYLWWRVVILRESKSKPRLGPHSTAACQSEFIDVTDKDFFDC